MTYEQTLAAARTAGAAHATDAGAMALFCDANLQTLVGAVSAQLVWEGAQRKGLTFRELAHLAATDPLSVGDLMWA